MSVANSSSAGHTEHKHHEIHGLDLRFVENPTVIYISILFAAISCIISFSDLREHLARFDYPKLQVLEMRVLLMMPIYAVLTALSLVFVDMRFFFTTIRDTYEAFVLYMFFMLMIAYCGGEGQLLRSLKRRRYRGVHLFPMCWLPTFALDTDFYLRCKRWVLQCALIKPISSFVAMVGSSLGIYSEGHFSITNLYTYDCIVMNISLTMALYYLVLFEVECEKDLHYAKTFLKFLCVKSIIFFSYWQSIMVSLAAMVGILYMGDTEEEKERLSGTIQDVLMCLELLPVAFMHRAAFGRDKLDEEMACVPLYMKDQNEGDFRSNVDTALNVNDIIDDTVGTIFFRRGKLVDQENGEGGEDDLGAGEAGMLGAGGAAADVFGADPTLEELVQHAVATDYGVRMDGLVHYDEDSDREERNIDTNYTDADVMLRRSRFAGPGDDVRVDQDLLQTRQGASAAVTPQVYCVVCGRFDRELVRRRNGYKCKACVGIQSQRLLRERQREATSPLASPPISSIQRGRQLPPQSSPDRANDNVDDDDDDGEWDARRHDDVDGASRHSSTSGQYMEL